MKLIKPLLLLLLTVSCVKDVDFDQARNLTINPVLEASIVYFNAPANTFFVNDDGEELPEAQDATVIKVFNSDFLVDNLIRAVFTFKIANSVKRGFQTRIDFLNTEDEVQHTFTVNTAASINNEDVITDHIEVFEGDEALTALKTTNKMVFTAILSPSTDGSVINQNTIGRVELKSKATFFLNINTDE